MNDQPLKPFHAPDPSQRQVAVRYNKSGMPINDGINASKRLFRESEKKLTRKQRQEAEAHSRRQAFKAKRGIK